MFDTSEIDDSRFASVIVETRFFVASVATSLLAVNDEMFRLVVVALVVVAFVVVSDVIVEDAVETKPLKNPRVVDVDTPPMESAVVQANGAAMELR